MAPTLSLSPHKLIQKGKLALHPLHDAVTSDGSIRIDQDEIDDLSTGLSNGSIVQAIVQIEEIPTKEAARFALFERIGKPVSLAPGVDAEQAKYWIVSGLSTAIACSMIGMEMNAVVTKLAVPTSENDGAETIFKSTLDKLKTDYRRDDKRVSDYRIGAILVQSKLTDKVFSERTKIELDRVQRSKRTYLASKEFGIDPEASGLTDFGIAAMRNRLAPRIGNGHTAYQGEVLRSCIAILAEEGRKLKELVRGKEHVNERPISKNLSAAIAEHAYLIVEQEEAKTAVDPSQAKMSPDEIARQSIDAIFWRKEFANEDLISIVKEGGINYYDFRRATRLSPNSQKWLVQVYMESSNDPDKRKLTDGNFRLANNKSRMDAWNGGEDKAGDGEGGKPMPKRGLAGVFAKFQLRAKDREQEPEKPVTQGVVLKVGPTSQAHKILQQAGIRDFGSVVWIKNTDGSITIRSKA